MQSPDSGRVQAALAYTCEHLHDLRSTLGDDGTDASTPLNRLLEAVRTGDEQGISSLLEQVHNAVQSAGDALGVFGNVRSWLPVGVTEIEIVHRCPHAACSGRDGRSVSEDLPRCAIDGRELRRERLL